MENNVPYIVYEAQGARLERANKRLSILNVILIVVLVISNLTWICYENSFEEVVYTTTIEAVQESNDGGTNTIIGGFYNAETDGQNYQECQNTKAEGQEP